MYLKYIVFALIKIQTPSILVLGKMHCFYNDLVLRLVLAGQTKQQQNEESLENEG